MRQRRPERAGRGGLPPGKNLKNKGRGKADWWRGGPGPEARRGGDPIPVRGGTGPGNWTESTETYGAKRSALLRGAGGKSPRREIHETKPARRAGFLGRGEDRRVPSPPSFIAEVGHGPEIDRES